MVSNVGKQNLNGKLLDPLKKQNVDLEGLNFVDEKNTNFVLEYHDHSRSLILNSKSPDIEFETFPESYLNKNIDAIVLVPLCNEISKSFVQKILEKFPNIYIGIDLQGFIRKIDNNGRVNIVHDDKIKKDVEMVIKSIGSKLILKGSEEEMKILSGKQDLMKVMQYFQKFKGTFIMTLGEKGSMITKNGKKIINIPAYKPNNVADETGAGDVYLAIFLYEYINSKCSLFFCE
ncbi:MAG: PfkB family carbohydrate kinase [Candidatus Lokiarchaeota archaeon]